MLPCLEYSPALRLVYSVFTEIPGRDYIRCNPPLIIVTNVKAAFALIPFKELTDEWNS